MASSFAVSTIFNLKDRMTPGFKKMGQSAAGFGSVVKGILSASIIQTGFAKLQQGMSSFVTEASKVEDAVAGFTPLMGGVERATQLVDRLNKEAATTPFQFEGIAGVAKQLLPVMNGSIEKTADTFRMLGDTAGGNIQKLDSITRGYTKAMLKGKPDMEALNMIAEAGVPIFTEMSKTMGISVAQLTQMSSKGKLTNDALTKTFQNMTKEGGIFFKGMEIASQTFTGKMSTLRDNVALTAGAIGSTFMDVLKDGTDQLINIASGVRGWVTANRELIKSKIMGFIQGFKNVLDIIVPPIKRVIDSIFNLGKTIFDIIKNAITPFTNNIGGFDGVLNNIVGTLDFASNAINLVSKAVKTFLPLIVAITAAIVAYNVVVQISSIITNRAAIATKAWAAVQAVLNVIMNMNPVGLIIAGVIVLIGLVVLLVQNFEAVSKAVGGFFAGIGNFFKGLWEWFIKILDNPLIAAVGMIFAPWLTIPALIVKHWEPIKKFFEDLFGTIGNVVGGIGNFFGGIGKGIGDFFGGVGDFFTGGGNKKQEAPNKREVEAREAVRLEGEININGAPAGSTARDIRRRGAPQIRYNMLGAQ